MYTHITKYRQSITHHSRRACTICADYRRFLIEIGHSNNYIYNLIVATFDLMCFSSKHAALAECRTQDYIEQWCKANREKYSLRITKDPVYDKGAPTTTVITTTGQKVDVCIVCTDEKCFENSGHGSNPICYSLIGLALLSVSHFMLC